jgi:TonB family protein
VLREWGCAVRGTWTRAAAVTIVLLGAPLLARAQTGSDPELAKGVDQVQSGALDDAVDTLSAVVRRLSPIATRRDDLAQAYLWLGIAYAQQDREKSGRASFREALKLEPRVSLAAGWPPKVTRLFEAVRAESAQAAAAAPSGSAPATGESAVFEKAEALARAGRAAEAEATYRDWFQRNPRSLQACVHLAQAILLPPAGTPARFDDGIAVFESCLPLEPDGTESDRYQAIAQVYWDKAYKDLSLTDAQKERYADRGIVFVDRALSVKPNLIDSLIFKGLLLRMKASVSKDPEKQKALIGEAGRLQARALELKASGKGEMSGAFVPQAPPPPPPPPPSVPVRVGGAIKEPKKLKDVRPVYPAIAQQARVQGVVILECTIDGAGKVTDTKVLRSIPLLDLAAQEAVRQWLYTPTLLNGVPVPVIMTVTVSFTLS